MNVDTFKRRITDAVSDNTKRTLRRTLPPIVFDKITQLLDTKRRVRTDIETPAGTITLPLSHGDNLRCTSENPREEPLPRLPESGFEPTFVRSLVDHLDRTKVYYDIGSAKGYFVEIAKNTGVPEDQIHLFDPSPVATELRSRYSSSSVTAAPVGDGSEEEAISLSEYAEEEPKPDVVKIDVEGAEFDVLRGLVPLSPVVYVEVHPLLLSADDSVPEMIEFLTNRGYDVAWADHRRVEGDWYDTEVVPLPLPSTLSTNSDGPYMLRGIPIENNSG